MKYKSKSKYKYKYKHKYKSLATIVRDKTPVGNFFLTNIKFATMWARNENGMYSLCVLALL